jgi:hypothetical protein
MNQPLKQTAPVQSLLAENQRLTDALEKAEKDAAKYRWLRRRDLDTLDLGGMFVGKTPDNLVLNGVDLDMALDAAMGEQNER